MKSTSASNGFIAFVTAEAKKANCLVLAAGVVFVKVEGKPFARLFCSCVCFQFQFNSILVLGFCACTRLM